jgi:hypothetical protein
MPEQSKTQYLFCREKQQSRMEIEKDMSGHSFPAVYFSLMFGTVWVLIVAIGIPYVWNGKIILITHNGMI